MLREQLGRLGNTPYQLAGLDLQITGAPFAPVSLLNGLRREAVAELQKRQEHPRPLEVADAESTLHSLLRESRAVREQPPKLHILVRNAEQLDAALAAEPASITLDYLDLYGLKPSVERVKSAGIEARVASPRVLKPGEERIVDFLLRLECPILVRSAGLLEALRGRDHAPLTGDFGLNVANSITGDTFLGLGLERITPTHDLNAAQIANLARQLGGPYIEAIAYGHLPVFHTEHCVFCRFLSSGKDYRDCGRPCEKHVVSIRDLNGRAHPVIADVGCRNTVFGAEAQEASVHLAEWRDAGVVHYRLEFAHESRMETVQVTKAFHDALQGRRSFRSLADELKRIAPQGTTEGSLYVPKDYAVLPVLQ
jgi:putative protease